MVQYRIARTFNSFRALQLGKAMNERRTLQTVKHYCSDTLYSYNDFVFRTATVSYHNRAFKLYIGIQSRKYLVGRPLPTFLMVVSIANLLLRYSQH